jgi:hypothetical protein
MNIKREQLDECKGKRGRKKEGHERVIAGYDQST